MSKWKRFLWLGSLSLVLLAGWLFTSHTLGSRTAFASGCNSVATAVWDENCTVYEGNISNFVVAIQTAINESGTSYNGHVCSTGSIDGHFGSNTLNGVKCFQGAKGIDIDGIVGPQTWGTLNFLLTYYTTQSGSTYYYVGNASGLDFEMNDTTEVYSVYFDSVGKYCVMNLNSLGC